jgi:2-methylisocitrate lyase-like PEP mutase family enzyme
MSHTQSITSTVATYDAIHAAIAQHAPLSIIYATGGVVGRI